ncbi:MAG TPA: outer membrane beta-barrel protein [Terriglobales bacterium]|jgi:outer membrane immunogenic protein|nr:outer membrane beta-barrel protein [Terriglobales bacterium]
MRTAGLAMMIFVLALTTAKAQDRLDLSVSGAAVFSKSVSSTTSGLTLAPADSGAVFGTVRYHFNHLHAAEFNVGHTVSSQLFQRPPETFKVRTTITEFSAAYVLTPLQGKRLEPFLFAGAGALRWYPENQYINGNSAFFGAYTQTSLAFLYGGGADYRLWRRLGLRMQYRGLIFRAPDFGVSDFFISAKGHMAEPSAGIVVKF